MNTYPTDGYGIFDGVASSSGQSVWGPHLDAIAAGGFKVVNNDSLCAGRLSKVIAYINYADSVGLKVVVPFTNASLLNGADWSRIFIELAVDATGVSHTDGAAFCTWLVNQIKGLNGLWGYYVGDEPDPANHAAIKVNTDAIHAADATHPRIIVESGTGHSIWAGGSPYYDCADVIGDDWYVLDYTAENNAGHTIATTGSVCAAGDQAYADAHRVQSCITLQAFNANQYPYQVCTPWPSCATFPTYAQLLQGRNLAIANMKARVIFWFSYDAILSSHDPAGHWTDLVNVISAPLP